MPSTSINLDRPYGRHYPNPNSIDLMRVGAAEMHDLPGLARRRAGVADLLVLLVGELVEVVLEAVDELADLADFGGARGSFGLGPLIEVGGGQDTFPVGEQSVEVSAQFGLSRFAPERLSAAVVNPG